MNRLAIAFVALGIIATAATKKFTSNLYIPEGQIFLLGEYHDGTPYDVTIDNIGKTEVEARIIDRSTNKLITRELLSPKANLAVGIPADARVELENLGDHKAHLTVVLLDGFVEGMRYIDRPDIIE